VIKQQYKILIFLIGVVALCLFIWQLEAFPSRTVISSQTGIWDLRAADGNCVQLTGPAEYVPYALLTPEEFSASDQIVVGRVPNGTSYLTSRIRILVPKDGYYELAGFMADFGSRLYVNGEWVADSGKPAETKEENVAIRRFLQITVHSKDGMIEIVQQSSNFVFRNNMDDVSWLVGDTSAVAQCVTAAEYSAVIATGIYVALALVHLLLFLLVPSYRSNLWGALLCFIWILRTGVVRARLLTTLLPNLDWGTALRIEYLTVVIAVFLIGQMYNSFFPGMLPKRERFAIYGCQAAFVAAYLVLDPLLMSKTIFLYLILAVFNNAYVFVRFVLRIKTPDFKQKLSVYSLFFILAGVVLDSLYGSLGIQVPFMHDVITEVAIAAFSFCQMTAMLLGVMEEMAQTRQAEQRLAAEKAALESLDRMKTEFLGNVSHELKTPLTVMSGYAQTAKQLAEKEKLPEGGEIARRMTLVSSEAERLSLMVGQILDVTRMEEGRMALEPVTCYVDEIIHAAVETHYPILNKNNNRLEIHIESGLPAVSADPARISQIVVNLISNAVRFTANGLITLSAKREDSHIEVCVQDTGTGISPERLPRIFERYGQKNKPGGGQDTGTGLGLYICRHIVEQHGGEIWISSEQGHGTSVFFTLPVP